MSPSLICPACATPLDATFWNTPDFVNCPGCTGRIRALAFPALLRPFTPGSAGQRVQELGEAACFFHPDKQAVVPCAKCGRFLCRLCDLELHDEHVCPSCLEAGRTKGKIQSLETRRLRYDRIAFGLATLPLLFCFLTVLTAPMTLYVAVRYWNAPFGLVQRSRAGFILAVLFALAEISFWVLVFTGTIPMFTNLKTR